jgi:hypothetical protein
MDGLRVKYSSLNPAPFMEPLGIADPACDNGAASIEYPLDGSVQGQSASGPAPNQADRTFVAEFTNPTTTDTVLYTVPNIATTLAAACAGGAVVSATLTSAVGVIPGMYLTVDTGALQEMIKVITVNQSTGVITAYVRKPHASGVAVTCQRTFYMTDLVVTTSSTSAHPARLKCRTTISSGAITAGTVAVTIANIAVSPTVGDLTFVGGTVYMDDPSSGTYEAVKPTAISRNAAGIITGFTAVFAQNHAANVVCAFPIAASWVNNTKGIEVVGQESQPTAPPGSSLAVNFTQGAAVTGVVMANIAGFEQ